MIRAGVFSCVALAGVLVGCGDPPPHGKSYEKAPPPKPIELDTASKSGKDLYLLHCQSCHGVEGQGVPQIFPALAGSTRFQSPKNFAHGLIHGFPVPAEGSPWMGEMPKFGYLSDEDLAKLATYARQNWGNANDEVTVEIVAEQRANP